MKKQLGRSMIEMLGTLAIVGVLSIVGVAGFKTAMLKKKANDVIEDVKVAGFIVQSDLFDSLEIGQTETSLTGHAVFLSGLTFSAYKETETTYAVVLRFADEKLCSELKSRKVEWLEEVIVKNETKTCMTEDNILHFYFNVEMTGNTEIESKDCRVNSDCGSGENCCKGVCQTCACGQLLSGSNCVSCPTGNGIVPTTQDCSVCGTDGAFRKDQYCVSCQIANNYYSLVSDSTLENCRVCSNRCFDTSDNKCKGMTTGQTRNSDGSCVLSCEVGQILQGGSGASVGCVSCPTGNGIVTTTQDCSVCGTDGAFRTDQYCVSCQIANNYYSLVSDSTLENCRVCSNRCFDTSDNKCKGMTTGQTRNSDGSCAQ